ncbi:MAG: SDR family NAD(P)-dependent oxidoreductase [Kangiellaceae bacterium]|nr:SDR family NAD(P)-dependent oxidoreductase [Kangiellaceae bacterium]
MNIKDETIKADRKLVVITGASSGFGQACAERFAAEGWLVVAAARREERLVTLQQKLGESNCIISALDVSNSDSINRFTEFVFSHAKRVDVLVNNAGLALGILPAHQAELSDWQTMIETNIIGLTKMTRAFLPHMVDSKNGHVINLGSIAGSYPYPGANVYGATKAFVEQFSLNLRADLGGTGIRVTNIEPGLAETEFSQVRFHGDQQKASKLYQDLEPLVAADIAESIYWCASLPQHVNINRLEIMPTCQSFAPLAIAK